jgi:hypothetical protein
MPTLKFPAFKGIPLMTPLGAKLRPSGNPVADQVISLISGLLVVSAEVRDWLYAAPTRPFGRLIFDKILALYLGLTCRVSNGLSSTYPAFACREKHISVQSVSVLSIVNRPNVNYEWRDTVNTRQCSYANYELYPYGSICSKQ